MRNAEITLIAALRMELAPPLNTAQWARLTEEGKAIRKHFGPDEWIDCNPFPIPGDIVACGPSSGEWMAANGLKFYHSVYAGGVLFTLAVPDPA